MLPARQDTTSVLLHVDDNADDLVLLQAAIRMAAIPFRLRQFATVAAAIVYLRGHESFADRDLCPLPIAVLLDHELSGFAGADALPEIRKLPGCSTLPFVIFSGSESPLAVRQSYEAGADHFITKTSDLGRLELILKTLYGCATSNPRCYLALRALTEYQPFLIPVAKAPSSSSN
jgi:CheY-like chemotaxis protein